MAIYRKPAISAGKAFNRFAHREDCSQKRGQKSSHPGSLAFSEADQRKICFFLADREKYTIFRR
jgi:hypothetical protein